MELTLSSIATENAELNDEHLHITSGVAVWPQRGGASARLTRKRGRQRRNVDRCKGKGKGVQRVVNIVRDE